MNAHHARLHDSMVRRQPGSRREFFPSVDWQPSRPLEELSVFGELTDEVTQQIEAIKTWALVLEIAAMVTALGVVVMAVTLLTYAVQSLRRQDELLKLERARRADQQARQQIKQATQGFPTVRPQPHQYGGPWQP